MSRDELSFVCRMTVVGVVKMQPVNSAHDGDRVNALPSLVPSRLSLRNAGNAAGMVSRSEISFRPVQFDRASASRCSALRGCPVKTTKAASSTPEHASRSRERRFPSAILMAATHAGVSEHFRRDRLTNRGVITDNEGAAAGCHKAPAKQTAFRDLWPSRRREIRVSGLILGF